MFYEINHIAVFTGTLVAFFVGWLWYGPLFGKQWMAMMGYTKANMKSMKMKPGTAMVLGFLSLLLMAYVVAIFANYWNYQGFYGAFKLSSLIWLGFIATVMLGSVLWENRDFKLYLFNILYQFVVLFVITAIIVMWN